MRYRSGSIAASRDLSCTRLRVPPVALHVSRYTCRATRVAADFLDCIALCRCGTGVAPHPLKSLVSHLPPPIPGRCRTEIWVWKGVALHGGVAATVAGVALYCATKRAIWGHYESSGQPKWRCKEDSISSKPRTFLVAQHCDPPIAL